MGVQGAAIALAVASAMVIPLLAAALLAHLWASDKEAAERHRRAVEEAAKRRAEELAQWEAVRGAMGACTAQVAHAVLSMADMAEANHASAADLAAAIRIWAAIPPAPESSMVFSEDRNPPPQRGAVIAARSQFDTDPENLPPIPPYDPAVSDRPTLPSNPHPPEPTRTR